VGLHGSRKGNVDNAAKAKRAKSWNNLAVPRALSLIFKMTNYKQKMERYQNSKLLSASFNNKPGVIKISVANTLEHELAKFFTCWELANQGKSFVTEAIFENKKRADIFVLDDGEAIEIVKSESKESIRKKRGEYPCGIIVLDALEVVRSWMKKIS